jgi:translocation and assembly module TamB
VGKRLSQDFYVAYETGLAGAVGTLQVFYDLSRRISLRASTGTQSAVDLIFTHRYD